MWAGSVRACVCVCVRACEETLTAGAFNQRKNTLEPGQNQVLAKTKRTPAKNARRRTFFTHTRTNTQTRNGERRQRTAFGRRVRCVSWAEPGLRVDRAAGIFSFAHAQRSRRGANNCTPSRCSGCAGVFSRAIGNASLFSLWTFLVCVARSQDVSDTTCSSSISYHQA